MSKTRLRDILGGSFLPAHFPAGTQFTANKLSWESYSKPADVHTAHSISRTGICSFIVNTTSYDHYGVQRRFHIQHVDHIIKRGDGQVVFTQQKVPALLCSSKRKKAKTKYRVNSFAVYDLVMALSVPLTPHYACLDLYGLCTHVMNTVPHAEEVHEGFCSYTLFDKQKLRKAIRQNFNRFLIKAHREHKSQHEEDMRHLKLDHLNYIDKCHHEA